MNAFLLWLGKHAQGVVLFLIGLYVAADLSPFFPEGWILDELLLIPVGFIITKLIGLSRAAQARSNENTGAQIETLRAQVQTLGAKPEA